MKENRKQRFDLRPLHRQQVNNKHKLLRDRLDVKLLLNTLNLKGFLAEVIDDEV